MTLMVDLSPGEVSMGALRKAAVSADVFITDELFRRAPKKTDYLQEKLALQDLARQPSPARNHMATQWKLIVG